MRKQVLIVVGSVSFAALAFFIYKAGVFLMWWAPLTRPPTVSRTAHHVFLWESEGWFDCSVDTTRDVDVCQAWDGFGRLIASGDFRLKDENRAATGDELHPSTTGPSDQQGLSNTIYLFGPKGKIVGEELVRVSSNGARYPPPSR